LKIFGLEISRAKTVSPVNGQYTGLFGAVLEPFAGAWQKGIETKAAKDVLAFSAVYSCVSLIANDIAKLRIKLMEYKPNDSIWQEVRFNSPFLPVLRKPNPFQTRVQFLAQWVISLLLYGNAYIIKKRDSRGGDNAGVVRELYVLDPRQVKVMTSDVDGSVWYDIKSDALNNVITNLVVPSSEIIHDRRNTLFHPLVGVSPIYACGISASQGLRIQENSSNFFQNMSRPAGQLTAPGRIDDITAERLKRTFESNFSGQNIGRMFVGGDGLKFEAITMPASDAQLIEQLKWTVEDVARCFHVPLHKVAAGQDAKFSNMRELNQDYYTQTLQGLIESIEVLLDEGIGLENYKGNMYGTELELDGLLRMDPLSRAEVAKAYVSASIWSPNDARQREDMPPVDGGEEPLSQQQYFQLSSLKGRPPPSDKSTPALPAPPAKELNVVDARKMFADVLRKKAA
jgi:HK97 family phage portal protein